MDFLNEFCANFLVSSFGIQFSGEIICTDVKLECIPGELLKNFYRQNKNFTKLKFHGFERNVKEVGLLGCKLEHGSWSFLIEKNF